MVARTELGAPTQRPSIGLGREGKAGSLAADFVRAVRTGGAAPIPFEELVETTRVTLEVAEALRP